MTESDGRRGTPDDADEGEENHEVREGIEQVRAGPLHAQKIECGVLVYKTERPDFTRKKVGPF